MVEIFPISLLWLLVAKMIQCNNKRKIGVNVES